MKKLKRTPEQKLIIDLMEAAIDITKAVIDFQNKEEVLKLKRDNLFITRHPVKFQPFDKPPNPPPLRSPIDYKKRKYRKKLEGVKKFFINIINETSHEK